MGDPFDHLREAMLPSGQISAEELAELARLATGCTVLEVGSGWSTVAMGRTAKYIYSVDLRERRDVEKAIEGEGLGNVALINGDSRSLVSLFPNPQADEAIYEVIRPEGLIRYTFYNPDGVFIDGDHSYDAALSDIREAKRIARRWIAVHDYDPRFPGVVRAFGEVLGSPQRIVGVLAILNLTEGPEGRQ